MELEKMTVFECMDRHEKDGTVFVLNDGKMSGYIESDGGGGGCIMSA